MNKEIKIHFYITTKTGKQYDCIMEIENENIDVLKVLAIAIDKGGSLVFDVLDYSEGMGNGTKKVLIMLDSIESIEL
jgi:hypothetical protein